MIELLKIVVPAFVVFLTTYFLLRSFLSREHMLSKSAEAKESKKIVLPIRFQAYERLLMMCERMDIAHILNRLDLGESRGKEISYLIIATVQQEFEHNITQQLYVSTHLWQVICVSRDQVVDIIRKMNESMDPNADEHTYLRHYNAIVQQIQQDPIAIAKGAVKSEAASIVF